MTILFTILWHESTAKILRIPKDFSCYLNWPLIKTNYLIRLRKNFTKRKDNYLVNSILKTIMTGHITVRVELVCTFTSISKTIICKTDWIPATVSQSIFRLSFLNIFYSRISVNDIFCYFLNFLFRLYLNFWTRLN